MTMAEDVERAKREAVRPVLRPWCVHCKRGHDVAKCPTLKREQEARRSVSDGSVTMQSK